MDGASANQPGAGDAGVVGTLDRWVATKLWEFAGRPKVEIQLWDGETAVGERYGTGVTRLRLADRGALWTLFVDPDLNFGDLYSSGRADVEGDGGLVAFLESVYLAAESGRDSIVNRLSGRVLRGRPRSNSLTGSRDNIHHHYDIGNDFYTLWLDDAAMQYTCAYFPDPSMTLEQAQVAKLHHVCRKLQLQPGESVVEAGCGWGGLARFMAKHYGVKVRAYNISQEQVAYARERAQAEGLAGQVEYVLDDYRNVSGQFDAFVSVGMLEHVGPDHYRELGGVIDACLQPLGRGLIHSIGRNRPGMMNAWIEKRIFPGAHPPALSEMVNIFEPWNFSILDVENLRLHYAKTLEHWLQRFEQQVDVVRQRYDEAFVRAWRLYLAGSIAAFEAGSLQLFQVVFTRTHNNMLPWSRAHLYQ
ncbi:MAG: cyclopropane-fatty-acyl-phospholipid synthase [Gammaproteobacteria bacterium SG8_47]|nr:MAG: cyclopropane-fatty-acyl-phospholipid synthase [Gammaproteobacteria bacterium SG8_47]